MRKLIYIFVFGVLLSGCATMLKSPYKEVKLNSVPQGARVYLEGNRKVGETPLTVKLKDKYRVTITFRKEGFEEQSYTIGRHFEWGWLFPDLLLYPIAIPVDAISSNWFGLDETEVNVNLEPKLNPGK